MPVADMKVFIDVIFAVVLALALPLVWGAVQAYPRFGRVLTFAAWLYIALTLPGLLTTISAHHFPIQSVLMILAAVAIIVCQRQLASKTYYASHRR
jgi:hypothetical protein